MARGANLPRLRCVQALRGWGGARRLPGGPVTPQLLEEEYTMSEQTKAEAEVRQAFLAMMKAWNAHDVDTFVAHWHPEVAGFQWHGGVLDEDITKAGMTSYYDAGNKPALTVRQLSVSVYGNAALVTCYLQGRLTYPSDAVERGTWRFSEMMVRQNGEWKGLHYHWSLLTAEHSITKP